MKKTNCILLYPLFTNIYVGIKSQNNTPVLFFSKMPKQLVTYTNTLCPNMLYLKY